MRRSVLMSLRLPSSWSDSSLCFLYRFIKEIIQHQLYRLTNLYYSSQLEYYMQYQTGYFEALAKSALYEPNNELKLSAEIQLTKVLFQMPMSEYNRILENCSEEVVLVVAAILRKNVHQMRQHTSTYMVYINSILCDWYRPNGTMVRHRHGELKFYILNTFGQFMGNCMKVLFVEPIMKKYVETLFESMAHKPHYQLFLYYCFIESVSTIDSDTKYVSYRTLLTSFQDTMIPRIFSALHPFFMNISDQMEITELSFLQSQLTVNQSPQTRRLFCISLQSQRNAFTELVFRLLEHVIAFRFNLSHKEYDDLDDFSKITISFPETLLTKIINLNFLHALYNILMRLMRTKEAHYQQICLNCLKKILIAKITYISKKMHNLFMINNLQGVLKLLQLLTNSKFACQRENIVHILQCNINFMTTFGLEAIAGCSLTSEKHELFFREWLQLTTMVPIYLLDNEDQHIDIENQLFMVGSEMLVTLANEFKIHSIGYDKQKYIEQYRKYSRRFMEIFIGHASFINGSKILTVEEFKDSCQFLSQVKVILTYNYSEVFNLFNDCCDNLYQGNSGQLNLGNFILLLREIIREGNFLEESIFGNGIIATRSRQMQEDGAEMRILGSVLYKTIAFIFQYLSNSTKAFGYLNNAIVFFLSTLIQQCARKITVGGDPQKPIKPYIDYQILKYIKIHFQNVNMDDQHFLLLCLDALTKFIYVPNISSLQFILTVLYESIVEIKVNMIRENFVKSNIYQGMVRFFNIVCQEPVLNPFLKSRVLLFKSMTVLSFDDTLDEYRRSIRTVIAFFKQEIAQGEYKRLLYELTGVFGSAERETIYKFIVRYFTREINFGQLIANLFNGLAFADPNQFLSDVLHLSWLFVSNKSNRLQGQGMQLVYKMLIQIIPYWNKYLEYGALLSEQALAQMYKSITQLVTSNSYNICLLDRYAPDDFRKLIFLLVSSMIKTVDSLQSSQELTERYFDLAKVFTEKVPKVLFNNEDPKIAHCINQFINTLMKKIALNFQTIASGAFEERLMKPILDIIHNYYAFLRKHRGMRHLRYLFLNISLALNDSQDKQIFLEAIMKIAMDFRQHFSQTLEHIAAICVNLVEFYKINVDTVIAGLGLSDGQDIHELRRIFHHISESLQENEWLNSQMKDWLHNKSRFYTPVDNDY